LRALAAPWLAAEPLEEPLELLPLLVGQLVEERVAPDFETESATSTKAWLSCRASSRAGLAATGAVSLAEAETQRTAANSAPRHAENEERTRIMTGG
jgi:hypothetical protein